MKRRSKRKHLDEEALVRAALSLYPGKPRCCGPCGQMAIQVPGKSTKGEGTPGVPGG